MAAYYARYNLGASFDTRHQSLNGKIWRKDRLRATHESSRSAKSRASNQIHHNPHSRIHMAATILSTHHNLQLVDSVHIGFTSLSNLEPSVKEVKTGTPIILFSRKSVNFSYAREFDLNRKGKEVLVSLTLDYVCSFLAII